MKETIMNRKQFLLTSIAILIALVVGAVLNNILQVQSVEAQAPQSIPRSIPKSYGALKGSVGNSLIFEDSAGTIRFVNVFTEAHGTGATIRRN
jgi:hypothetical protein